VLSTQRLVLIFLTDLTLLLDFAELVDKGYLVLTFDNSVIKILVFLDVSIALI
jgi:hypothetical protein